MKAINIKAYPTDLSQVAAIKAVMKALKIKFELSKEQEEVGKVKNEITNPAILESIELYEKGKVKPMPINLVDIKAITNA